MTTPPENNDSLLQEGIRMLKSGIDLENIRENLLSKSKSESEIDAIMKSIRELKFAQRRSRGVILCIIGAVLLVFGFVLVIALQDSANASRMAIYIPSVLGSGMVLWGFVDLLGW